VTIGSIQTTDDPICLLPAYQSWVRQSTVDRRDELHRDALAVIKREYADEDLSLSEVARASTLPGQGRRLAA